MPRDVDIMPIGRDDSQGGDDEKIVGDHSHDFLGTWRAVPFIFGMDLGETVATLGITLNLVGYLITKLHLSPSRAANIMTNVMGTNYLLTVVWGFIADSFLGKFWTVTISSLILLSGLALLTLRVALPSLRPDKCEETGNNDCPSATDREMTPIYIALYLVALGSGGVKPSISVLGADQFDDTVPDEKLQRTHFFNWFFYFIQVGSFTSVTFLVYVQDNVGFSWGYGILWALFFITMVGFFMGAPFYIHKVPSGSAVTRVAQVFVASFRKMKYDNPKHPVELYEMRDQDLSAIKGSRKLTHTSKFKADDDAYSGQGSCNHDTGMKRVVKARSRFYGGLASEAVDLYASDCSSNCAQYAGKFLCKICVDWTVALALKGAHTELETKVRFLQAYEPGPLGGESFRGDLTFVGCDLQRVYAHSFIMAGKSIVFRSMFNTDMMVEESGTIRVDDAVAPVLRSMVNYCYTADIQFTEEAPAEEVLKLAHKYDINELKAVCESELSRGINKENLCNRLRLAHKYDAKKLGAVAARFFKENFDEVYTSVVERLC